MSIKKTWAAEKYGMAKTFLGVVGRPTKVLDIEPEYNGEIGYTSAAGTIHLAYDHPVMDGLSDDEKRAFRHGVFAHETLHQIFTNFVAFDKAVRKYPPHERNVFSIINNVLEDPAIEYWAPTVIGGPLLASLKFTIAHIYRNSEDIDNAPSPMSQFIGALIQFGDMGLIKGHFTFPEAKKCFAECAPIFASGITESNAEKRIEISKKITEISRPLWEADANKEKMIEELMEELSKHFKSKMNGSGKGMDGDSDLVPSDDKKSKRRKVTIKKVTKEELEEIKKSSSSSGPPSDDEDITILVCDEDVSEEEKEKENGGSSIDIDNPSLKDKKGEKMKEDETSKSKDVSSDEKETDASKSSESSTDDERNASSAEKSDDTTKSSESSDSDETTKKLNNKKNDSSFGDRQTESDSTGNVAEGHSDEVDEYDDYDEITSDEYELSDEDIEYIKSEAERNQSEYEKSTEIESESDEPLDNFDIESPKSGHKKCLNYRVTTSANRSAEIENSYNSIVSGLNSGIRSLTNQLKTIFAQDQEEKEYRATGRVDIKRINSGRVTPRIFNKRRGPTGKSDLAITILVDESGSMSSGGRYREAMKCCVALAETFANLHIPIYILGFTADTQGSDVVHSHYVTWKNSRSERLKLLNISARANNCDGYSIRYAAKVLKKYNAKNRLLIVLSDGQPAAYGYSGKEGITDTKNAIREAKRNVSVLGVAIGNNDTETIHYMYEGDFLHVGNVQDLFFGLSKKIKNIIKHWE